MTSIRLSLFLLLFFFLSLHSYSQEPLLHNFEAKYKGNKFRIQTLVLDQHGNLICGTSQGVMTFDGNSFQPAFKHDSLSGQQVQSLFNGSGDIIWVGYKNGNIGKVHSGRFSWVKSIQMKTPITSFAEDSNRQRIYFTTMGEGTYYIHSDSLNKINNLNDEYCYKILKLPDDKFCIATDQGINLIESKNEDILIKSITFEQGLPDNIVRDIFLDKENKLYVAFQDKGYCTINLNTLEIRIPPESKTWRFGQVNCLLPIDDNIWIGTESEGLLNNYTGKSTLISGTKNLKQLNPSIKKLLADNEGNIWIGTGDNLIRSSVLVWNKLNDSNGNEFPFVHCILSDKQDNIWFSPDQQLYRAKKQNNGVYTFTKYEVTRPEKLTDIVRLWQDQYDNIWIGTLGEGVFVLNPKTGKIKHPGTDPILQKGNILAISGRNNQVLIGGFGGIHTFDVDYNKSADEYSLELRDTEISRSLVNNYIYSIHNSEDGKTWIATDEKGLVLLDENGVKFFNKDEGLESMTILSIASDKNGTIWMATQGSGIVSYNGIKFKNYSVSDGLSDPSPSSIIIDNDNRVLAIYPNGVDIFDPMTKSFRYYSTESGLGEINADLNSVTESSDGKIWIGTERGIFNYKPSGVDTWHRPAVKVRSILLFLEPLEDLSSRTFKHNQNNISIEYGATWLTDPNRISYSYRLEGYAQKWQTTKDRSVSYPKLSPGKYTFHIRASLNDEFSSSQEATYSFEIRPPFWQAIWFRIILSLAILVIIWLIIKRRENRLRRIEQEEKEKIEFQFETLRSQVNPHFLFNSFNTLITVIEQNPSLATEYVEHLSQFFRNIIGYKDIDVIPISEEIELLQNYLFIQSKRYGKHLHLNETIDKKAIETGFIPPLTLQLLAENAIKHNAISHETPLQIDLFQKDSYLVIRNNLNPKYSKEPSTGIGLQNIKNRYRILSDKKVLVEQDSNQFTVSIPIIKKRK